MENETKILAGNGEVVTVLDEERDQGHGKQVKVRYADGTEGWEHVGDLID